MRKSLFAVPLLLLFAVGCASAPPPAGPPPIWAFASATPSSGKELRMRSETRYVQVSVEGPNIFGPTWNLQHGGTYIRGYGAGHLAVQITLQETHAEGNVLNAPLTVDLKPLGNGVTQVQGLFGGLLSDFKISSAIFQGKLGQCSYDLKYNGERYEGQATCGGRIQFASLELPVAMATWRDIEVATLLAIVLSN